MNLLLTLLVAVDCDDLDILRYNEEWSSELTLSLEKEVASQDVEEGEPLGEKHSFLIYDLGEPVGYVSYYKRDQNAILDNLFIDKASRSKGTATKALTQLENTLMDQGITSIALTVLKENEPALHLYKKAKYVTRFSNDTVYLMVKELKIIQ